MIKQKLTSLFTHILLTAYVWAFFPNKAVLQFSGDTTVYPTIKFSSDAV